jgi:hypothetical protein
VAIFREGQADRLAECRTLFIVRAEQSARLKQRDDLIDKARELAGKRLEQDEAVRTSLLEPCLDLVGDTGRRSDERAARRCQPLDDLPQAEPLLADLFQDAQRSTLLAVEADMGDIRERRIEIILAEIVIVECA